jgi:cell wall-associated NlpC family hydrolase
MKNNIKFIAGAAAFVFAGAAFGQSHSVINMANPPNATAQSKAAVDATPSQSATAHTNTNKEGDSNAGQAGKSKNTKAKKKTTAKGAKTSAGSSAESAMETQPSEKTGSEAERKAFDVSPAHNGK